MNGWVLSFCAISLHHITPVGDIHVANINKSCCKPYTVCALFLNKRKVKYVSLFQHPSKKKKKSLSWSWYKGRLKKTTDAHFTLKSHWNLSSPHCLSKEIQSKMKLYCKYYSICQKWIKTTLDTCTWGFVSPTNHLPTHSVECGTLSVMPVLY